MGRKKDPPWLKAWKKAMKELQINKPRNRFSKATKNWTLTTQNFRCRICYDHLGFPEFDHIDGDRSNNLYWNCQALCPNCHAKKTRKWV